MEGHFLLTEQVTGVWPQAGLGRGNAGGEGRSLAVAQPGLEQSSAAEAQGCASSWQSFCNVAAAVAAAAAASTWNRLRDTQSIMGSTEVQGRKGGGGC